MLLCQALYVDYEAKFQCAAMLDIMPTIYARHLWIKQVNNAQDCMAVDIFGNQAGITTTTTTREPGCELSKVAQIPYKRL